jgi:ribose 5-phosphate isomerase B
MTEKTIVLASDHSGLELRGFLREALLALGWQPLDLGTDTTDSVDYPDYAAKVTAAVKGGQAKFGILICGTGIGMSIAANRTLGIRAALCHDVTTARLARQHNNAQILCLGARVIGPEVARDCLVTFLEATPEDGRHQRRVDKLG